MTEAIWSVIALGYTLAAVYLQGFDDSEHPAWVWLPFLGVGGAIFVLINGHRLWDPATFKIVEYLAMLLVAGAGTGMFRLALAYSDRETKLEMYREMNQTKLNDRDKDPDEDD